MHGRFQRFSFQAMKEGHTMEKKAFAKLVSSVQDMGRHIRGGKVAGARITRAREPEVTSGQSQ